MNEIGTNNKIMEYINISKIEDLKPGDIIKGKSSGITYTVIDIYGDRATAVRTADVTNPIEWEVLRDSD